MAYKYILYPYIWLFWLRYSFCYSLSIPIYLDIHSISSRACKYSRIIIWTHFMIYAHHWPVVSICEHLCPVLTCFIDDKIIIFFIFLLNGVQIIFYLWLLLFVFLNIFTNWFCHFCCIQIYMDICLVKYWNQKKLKY